MTDLDLTRRSSPIPTAKTVSPTRPGHAMAQAWYACLVERLAMEKNRQGASAPVSSNIVPIFDGLLPTARKDFVDALGALITDFLTMGEPNAGRWDPKESIADAVASEEAEIVL